MTDTATDEHWMQRALALAAEAGSGGEVPVGAVLVRAGVLVAEAANSSIAANDPTGHAEMVVLRQGAEQLGNYRLIETTLYVTLEPCMMCAGAIVHARVARLVFAAREPKAGAVCTHPLLTQDWLNHRPEICEGVLADRSRALLSDFFSERRRARITNQSAANDRSSVGKR